jgi:hypothetical protein
MSVRISIWDSKEIQAIVLALRSANKELQAEVRKYTNAEMLPEWSKGLAERATTHLEHRVLVDTARMKVSNQNVTLSAAGVGRSLSGKGSAKPADLAKAVEFGADRSATTTYQRRTRKGKTVTVRNRHTRAQFRPVNRKGYVVYPTAAELIPRFASLWVQTVMRTVLDAVDEGTS